MRKSSQVGQSHQQSIFERTSLPCAVYAAIIQQNAKHKCLDIQFSDAFELVGNDK